MSDVIDKTIGMLPAAPQILDESKFPIEQQGTAMYGTGKQLREFAQASVSKYVESAKNAAESASKSAKEAADSLSKIGTAVEDAEAARDAAQDAQAAVEAAQESVQQAKKSAEAAAERAETSEQNAKEIAEAVADFLASAKWAASDAAQSEQNAASSRQAAEAAQEAAESAQTAAESASTAATENAAEAAQSAETAKQYSGKPPIIQDGNWWTWDADAQEYKNTGKRAVLNFDVVYPSYEDMESDKDNHPALTTAIISSDVSDPHNAEIYIHDGTDWQFLADLSGFTGVGIENIEQTGGDHAPGTTDTYTITTTDGKTYAITVYNGRDGEGAGDVQGVPFTLTLYASGWSNGKQTVNDIRFLASGRYSYIVGGASPKENRDEYNECNVQADSIPSDNSMAFYCDSDPDNDLTVIVQRMENQDGGDTARIFNCGGGGGGGGGFSLDHLTILTPPHKNIYKSGELFDPDGMTVEVTYGNGLSVEVTNFTWSPFELTDGVENVTVTYSEGRKSVSALQPVTVISVLTSIAVTKNPSKMDYVYLETFQKDGMKVTAYYSDSESRTVDGYTVEEKTFTAIGENQIAVTYSEDGIKKETALSVTVGRAPIPVPSQVGAPVYTGGNQSPNWNAYDPAKMTWGGDTEGKDAGSYNAKFSLKYGWEWDDGSIEDKTVPWSIGRASIMETPSQRGTITEDGGEHTPEWNNYDPDKLEISGETSASIVGFHTVTFTPRQPNWQWADGTVTGREVQWEIVDATIVVPTPYVSGTLTYTGGPQKPVFVDLDREHVDVSGDKEGADAGDYDTTFTLHENCAWTTGGNEPKTVRWTIDRAVIESVPAQTGNLVYTGNTITPTWDTYDPAKMDWTGDRNGVNAGVYKAKFTSNKNWKWTDGGTETREVKWSIGKAVGTIFATPTTVTLDNGHTFVEVTVGTNSDGEITAVSQDISVATTSVRGKIVAVNSVKKKNTIGSHAEGEIIQLNENGQPVDFYIAKHNYEPGLNGNGRTLVVRKDCYDKRKWNSLDFNAYNNSQIDRWLNGDFEGSYKKMLDADVQAAMGKTTFYYTPGEGDDSVTTLSRSAFLLSLEEYGLSTSIANAEGTALPKRVVDLIKIARFEGSPISHWTRTPVITSTTNACQIGLDGSFQTMSCTGSSGFRPAFTIHESFDLGEKEYASGTTTVTISVAEGTNWTKSKDVSVSVNAEFKPPIHIYGALWDGSSTTKLTRTDDAGLFADPNPAVGNGNGSSPFDNCFPWSGMKRVTQDGNELVAIPKYWVKVSHAPFKVQIADKETPGYQVSPAHRDRGDGAGERDVVYIGRYECDDSYMSRTGKAPKVSTDLATFRSGISNLGAEYWQADFALQLTWWFLYIVEFADWDGQTAIGQGVVSASAKINTGGTDSMIYHTGRAFGTDGQTAVQYRGIENPCGNVREWRDGINFSGTNICTYNNPSNFTDTYNSTGATVRSNKRASASGWIKAWGYDSNDASFIYPSEVGGSEATFVPDYCYYDTRVRALNVGGNYGSGTNAGPFCLYGSNAPTYTNTNLGSRLQKLPKAA